MTSERLSAEELSEADASLDMANASSGYSWGAQWAAKYGKRLIEQARAARQSRPSVEDAREKAAMLILEHVQCLVAHKAEPHHKTFDGVFQAVDAILSLFEPSPAPEGTGDDEIKAAYKRGWNDREDDLILGINRVYPASPATWTGGWRTIAGDPPPRDGTEAIFYNPVTGRYVDFWDDGEWHNYPFGEPTHWHPLPPPPPADPAS